MTRPLAILALVAVAASPVVAEDKFFNSNGARIRYVEAGSGEAIVLIHGRAGSAGTWTPIMANLSRNYRVVALDCRGHGQSSKPHDPKQYGREMSMDIVRLLNHLGIKKAHVLGYSMGAGIASHVLTLHPERFLTAILGGSAGRFDWSEKDDEQFEREASEIEKWGFSPSARERQTGRRLSDAEIRGRSSTIFKDDSRDHLAIAALVRSFKELAVTPTQVASLTVPTLAIAGSADPNLAGLREMRRIRPSMELVVIEGATHDGASGAMLRPEFLAVVRKFLSAASR